MAEEISKAIVIDTGSGYCKAGMAGDESPGCCFPTVYAQDRRAGDDPVHLVGSQALAERERLALVRPISKGLCTDWDAIEQVWQYCFLNQLKLDSTEYPVLTSFYPDEHKTDKETTAMIFFETFLVPGYFCMSSSVMSLSATGKTSGIVFDSGEELTSACPIQEGYAIAHAHSMQDFGGRDVNRYLGKLLSRYSLQDEELLRQIKERSCYISENFELERERYLSGLAKPSPFELPDGSIFDIGLEAIQANEISVNPANCGFDSHISAADLIWESLLKVKADLRRELLSHVVLTGGNTMAKNYSKR
jgi:actin-related protein